jgi:RIO kinase 2
LTYLGYDYLALHTFLKRGLIKEVLGKIGVGKESDIYKCKTPEGDFVVLKLTRLGRNSFRSVKRNRDYIQHRTNYNWLYLSRLSSIREFLFMQLLHKNGFPVPTPIDTNRHAILMSLVDGDALCHIQRISTQREIRSIF